MPTPFGTPAFFASASHSRRASARDPAGTAVTLFRGKRSRVHPGRHVRLLAGGRERGRYVLQRPALGVHAEEPHHQAARERGLDVPGDLAVIGFDDLDFVGYLGLTTLRQPLFESGRLAMRLLRGRIIDGP